MGKIIYLVAAAGNPNFGDDLIALYWVRYLRGLCPEREIIVDCVNPANFSLILRRFGLLGSVCVVDTLWRLSASIGTHGLSLETTTAIAGIERPLRERRNIAWPLHELRGEIASLHFVGGGYFSEHWPSNFSLLAIGGWLRDFWRCPAFLTGAGFDIRSEMLAYETSLILPLFDHVSARAQAMIPGFDLSLVPDDVFLGLPDERAPVDENLLTVEVQRDSFASGDFARVSTQVRDLIAAWAGRVEGVCLYPGMDDVFLDGIEAQGMTIERVKYLDYVCRFMGDRMPAVGVSVGTRYHFHLAQASAGSSGAYSVSGEYYQSKHAIPQAAGSNWSILPEISRVPPIIPVAQYREAKSLEAGRLYA